MINSYINNFENTMVFIFFTSFKVILIVCVTLQILSLMLLILGCLIKSQKIKSKFLIVVPGLLGLNIIILFLPYILVHFKSVI